MSHRMLTQPLRTRSAHAEHRNLHKVEASRSRSFHAQPCISPCVCSSLLSHVVGVGCLRAGCISGMRQRARQPCQEERTTVNGLAENRVRHACAGASAGLPQAAVVQRAKGDDAAEGEWSPVMGVMMRRGFLSGRHKQGRGGRATEAGMNLPITNNIPVETTFTRFH